MGDSSKNLLCKTIAALCRTHSIAYLVDMFWLLRSVRLALNLSATFFRATLFVRGLLIRLFRQQFVCLRVA